MTGVSESGIPCYQIVVRGVEGRFAKPLRLKMAFMPGRSGRDNHTGVSVTALRENVLEALRNNVGDVTLRAGTLHVGRVRNVEACGARLDVVPQPLSEDPLHAGIVGFPHRSPDEEPGVTAMCERLGELLALQSRMM